MKLSFSRLFETFDSISTERRYLIGLGLVGALRFVNLGFRDLQAWDESLYAMRSLAVIRYGAWLDQTAFAVDGLYSSLHPPLYIWLTSATLLAIGQSEFTFRLWSALFGVATILLIFLIGKRIADDRTGFFAALLFGLNPFVSFFARQGQFDSALTFFLTLSVLLVLIAIQERRSKLFIYAGIAVGAALMSKLFVALGIPLAYVLWGIGTKQARSAQFRRSLLLLLLGASIALPWHLYMTITHGNGDIFFLLKQSALWERTFYGIEGNIKPTGPLYFVNQMIVLFPLGIAFVVAGLFKMKKESDNAWIFISVWFLLFFAVFTLIRTKLAVYLLPMLVPASLIAGRELSNVFVTKRNRKESILLLVGTALSLVWASNQDWRNAVKDLLGSFFRLSLPDAEVTTMIAQLVLALVASVGLIYVLNKWIDIQKFFKLLPTLLFLPTAAWCIYAFAFQDTVDYNDGAAELREFVLRNNHSAILVAGFERNPQLTYYLDGADIGWRSDLPDSVVQANLPIRRIAPPQRREDYRSWLLEELSHEPKGTLLIIEKDKLVRYEVIDPLPFVPYGMEHVFESRRYACFQRESGIFLAGARVVQ